MTLADRLMCMDFNTDQVFLAWRAADYEQRQTASELDELAWLGVDISAYRVAVWRFQQDATERWYRPYNYQ